MSLLPETAAETFNLLSIGQRGVGKTVFLAGSYAELHSDNQGSSQQLWFDCQDPEAQENIEHILSYIARTGQYPPSTMKITDFNFNLKRRGLRETQTLCHFLWWDIPGEICDIRNPDFREMVSTSHGCCVFIDAYSLVHKPAYQQALEKVIQQVMAIATLVSLNHLKYTFALILTKCDLLEPGPLSQSCLKKGLESLTTYLDQVSVSYQIFHSNIPIVSTEEGSILKVTGAAAPLLWLVCELDKVHHASVKHNPIRRGTRLLSGRWRQQDPVDGLTRNLHRTAAKRARVDKILNLLKLSSLPNVHRYFFILMFIGSVGIIGFFFVDYQWFQHQPNNLTALDQAKPEHLKVRLQQAQSYKAAGQVVEAEALYDEVLAEQKDNLNALVSKAILRHAQGDTKTAEVLFARAEKTAPTDLKAQIHAVAQETLQTPNKPMPFSK